MISIAVRRVIGIAAIAMLRVCSYAGEADEFLASLPTFFARGRLHSGTLEYSRFLPSLPQAGISSMIEHRYLLVFRESQYFERTLFLAPPGMERGFAYRISNGLLYIGGSGPPGGRWVLSKPNPWNTNAPPNAVQFRNDPLGVLDRILFGTGGPPCLKCELASAETQGKSREYVFWAKNKQAKVIWRAVESKDKVFVPLSVRTVLASGENMMEYQYEDWKNYSDEIWFPTATVIKNSESEAKQQPFFEKYVVHKFEPNIPIHNKWFLPQFPVGAEIEDQTLPARPVEPPLDLSQKAQ